MPLCSKCHQNEATVLIKTVMDGVEEEDVRFCKVCAPLTGYEGLSVEEIMAMSVIEKKCEFCEKDAVSGITEPRSTIYWCWDCGAERGRIILQLLDSEHPEWKRQFALGRSALSEDFMSELEAWAVTAGQKAIRILKDRGKKDDGKEV